jgi:hypothetical protein
MASVTSTSTTAEDILYRPDVVSITAGSIVKQVNTYTVQIGKQVCALTISYAANTRILKDSTWSHYLATKLHLTQETASEFTATLFDELKNALEPLSISVRVESKCPDRSCTTHIRQWKMSKRKTITTNDDDDPNDFSQ